MVLICFGEANVQWFGCLVAEDLYLKWRVEGVQICLKLLNLLLLIQCSLQLEGFLAPFLVERDRA